MNVVTETEIVNATGRSPDLGRQRLARWGGLLIAAVGAWLVGLAVGSWVFKQAGGFPAKGSFWPSCQFLNWRCPPERQSPIATCLKLVAGLFG